MAWTEDRITMLEQLWSAGYTAGQIAEEMGGLSRNAVVGKAHRLGLPSRQNPVDLQPLFERVIDHVTYVDPMSTVAQAARAVGLHPTIAAVMWREQIEFVRGTEDSPELREA